MLNGIKAGFSFQDPAQGRRSSDLKECVTTIMFPVSFLPQMSPGLMRSAHVHCAEWFSQCKCTVSGCVSVRISDYSKIQ